MKKVFVKFSVLAFMVSMFACSSPSTETAASEEEETEITAEVEAPEAEVEAPEAEVEAPEADAETETEETVAE